MYIPLNLQYREGNIQRCSLARKCHAYDLKQHSHGVLSILLDIIDILGERELTSTQIKQILHHDVLEIFTGDLPYVIKNMSDTAKRSWDTIEAEVTKEVVRQYPSLYSYTDEAIKSSLTESQFRLFKLADMLDLLIYTEEELRLGNQMGELGVIHRNAREVSAALIGEASKWFPGCEPKICEYVSSSGLVDYTEFLNEIQSMKSDREGCTLEIS